MIQHRLRAVIRKPVQVPIRMRAQHDGRLPGRRNRHHLKVPRALPQRVRDVRHHLARKPLLAVRVDDAEGDAGRAVRDHAEVAPVPAVEPAVEGVGAQGRFGGRVLVGRYVEGLAVDREAAVLDAVGVAAGDAAEVRVCFVDGVWKRLVWREGRRVECEGQVQYEALSKPPTMSRSMPFLSLMSRLEMEAP